ncbi:GAF domain-containing protein, partial [Actinomycetospora sp.]|uniref:GAF domain-containing protein n=1 Tax=Actinomycetospora sp. TaxID=1872135 RepID=UPI002F3FBCFE
AAAEMTGARHAVLGVIEGGRLATLLDELDAETRARIGALPVGTGVLGAPGRSVLPPRVPDRDRRAPADVVLGRREASSFLGVPIRVRGRVVGELYVIDKVVPSAEISGAGRDDPGLVTVAPFDDDDHDLLITVAQVVAGAIDTAALLVDAYRRCLVEAGIARLATDLLSVTADPPAAGRGPGEDPEPALDAVGHLLDAAMDLTGSFGAAVAEPGGGHPQQMRITYARGAMRVRLGQAVDRPGSLFGLLSGSVAGGPVVLEDIEADPRFAVAASGMPLAGPAVVVDLGGGDDRTGILLLIRTRDRGVYPPEDLELLQLLGTRAGTALRAHQANRRRLTLSTLEHRERLALSLQDTVFDELLRLSTRLSSLASRTTPLRHELVEESRHVDGLLTRLRTTLFSEL